MENSSFGARKATCRTARPSVSLIFSLALMRCKTSLREKLLAAWECFQAWFELYTDRLVFACNRIMAQQYIFSHFWRSCPSKEGFLLGVDTCCLIGYEGSLHDTGVIVDDCIPKRIDIVSDSSSGGSHDKDEMTPPQVSH